MSLVILTLSLRSYSKDFIQKIPILRECSIYEVTGVLNRDKKNYRISFAPGQSVVKDFELVSFSSPVLMSAKMLRGRSVVAKILILKTRKNHPSYSGKLLEISLGIPREIAETPFLQHQKADYSPLLIGEVKNCLK